MQSDSGDPLGGPYARVLGPDPVSGTFTVRIAEFPGCVVQGASVEEAYRNLEEAARDWIRTGLDAGKDIPEPMERQTFSGRVLVRLPASIHRRAAEVAQQERTSLNQLIVSAVSERIGFVDALTYLVSRAEKRLAATTAPRGGLRPGGRRLRGPL